MSRKALGRGLSALFTQTSTLESELVEIDLDRLDPTDSQPRQAFDQAKLTELADSIKANGIIQPIVARRKGDRFQIIAGERRWRAAQMLGLHRVPCIIKEVAEEHVLELSLIENIQREELNPIEEANAFKRLLEQLKTTQEEVAKRVGKDRTTITNALRLLKLPASVQKLVEDESLSMGHARALLSIDSAAGQEALAAEVVAKRMSVRETEGLVKKMLGRGAPASAAKAPAADARSQAANTAAAEQRLAKKLSAPVKIKFLQNGGLIEIRFTSPEDLMRLFDALIQRSTS